MRLSCSTKTRTLARRASARSARGPCVELIPDCRSRQLRQLRPRASASGGAQSRAGLRQPEP
eukprot:2699293-Pyramimonas_sp.AAC.1